MHPKIFVITYLFFDKYNTQSIFIIISNIYTSVANVPFKKEAVPSCIPLVLKVTHSEYPFPFSKMN